LTDIAILLYTVGMAKKKRVMFVLTDDMQDELNRLAAERGATLSGLVRSILGEYLEWALPWGGRRDKPAPPDGDEAAGE
jgi:hypothetical protein